MQDLKHYIEIGDLKKALEILTIDKGINLKFLCNQANLNYSLISKYKRNVVADIGADKKEALKNTITNLYI